MDKIVLKSAEDALSNILQIGFVFVNDGLKNASLLFVESLQNNLALEEALNDIHERNVVESAHFLTFMDVFALTILISTHFVRPLQK